MSFQAAVWWMLIVAACGLSVGVAVGRHSCEGYVLLHLAQRTCFCFRGKFVYLVPEHEYVTLSSDSNRFRNLLDYPTKYVADLPRHVQFELMGHLNRVHGAPLDVKEMEDDVRLAEEDTPVRGFGLAARVGPDPPLGGPLAGRDGEDQAQDG